MVLKKLVLLFGCCGMLAGLTGCGDEPQKYETAETETQSEDTESLENRVNEGEESGVYEQDGYLAEKTDLLNERMLEVAAKRFQFLYETYLEPEKIQPYFAIIPDKTYYLDQTGDARTQFEQMTALMRRQCPFMQYEDLSGQLSLQDYYRTDSHWRQEKLVGVAEYLSAAMGNPIQAVYETRRLENLFEGSYYDKINTTVKPDDVYYLTNEELEGCTVSKFEGMGEEAAALYDMEKAQGDNPYDLFLGGAVPIVTITNPNAHSGRNLILFRDSFGSSIAPLFAAGYEHVTLVDIRYIKSDMVGDYVDFSNADVLFLYSSLLLNNSSGMK